MSVTASKENCKKRRIYLIFCLFCKMSVIIKKVLKHLGIQNTGKMNQASPETWTNNLYCTHSVFLIFSQEKSNLHVCKVYVKTDTKACLWFSHFTFYGSQKALFQHLLCSSLWLHKSNYGHQLGSMLNPPYNRVEWSGKGREGKGREGKGRREYPELKGTHWHFQISSEWYIRCQIFS